MKLTIDECLEKWAGTKVGISIFRRQKGKIERHEQCLVNTKTKNILNYPDSREILAALVAKAGGKLEV